tara:strand:- start:24324 stop:24500 length:177 start_codon:yes stop_codon:yes gene_type:complete
MKTKIKDTFYLEKFMELQRANVVLWRKLKTLEETQHIKEAVEASIAQDFFKDIDDLIK